MAVWFDDYIEIKFQLVNKKIFSRIFQSSNLIINRFSTFNKPYKFYS